MTTMSADTTMTDTPRNIWLSAGYAGVITAVIAVLTTFGFQWGQPILYGLLFLLTGAGPVLGYQLSRGAIFSDWKAIIGGIVGFILIFIGWPILVGLLSKEQSLGKLLLGSILGFILGVVIMLLLATFIGQNPYWIGTGWTFLWAVWGGTCGAAMEAWRTDV